jgi:hypothetical protein
MNERQLLVDSYQNLKTLLRLQADGERLIPEIECEILSHLDEIREYLESSGEDLVAQSPTS